MDALVEVVTEGADLRPVNGVQDEERVDQGGDAGFRSPAEGVPRISFDYFFLGDRQPIRATKSPGKMTNKELRALTACRETDLCSITIFHPFLLENVEE